MKWHTTFLFGTVSQSLVSQRRFPLSPIKFFLPNSCGCWGHSISVNSSACWVTVALWRIYVFTIRRLSLCNIVLSLSCVPSPSCPPHIWHCNDLMEVVAVGRGCQSCWQAYPPANLPSILSAVITPDIAAGCPPQLLSPSVSPNHHGIGYPTSNALPSAPIAVLRPLFTMSFEHAANFWPLLLERVEFL